MVNIHWVTIRWKHRVDWYTEQGARKGLEQVRKRSRTAGTQRLKLEWRDGPRPPGLHYGHSAAKDGGVVYFCQHIGDTSIFTYTIVAGK